MVRDFYTDLKTAKFKPSTYTIYNELDDAGYIAIMNSITKENTSIEDIEYCNIDLSEKEQFLVKMYNKSYTENINNLKKLLSDREDIVVKVDREKGNIRVIKLKKSVL